MQIIDITDYELESGESMPPAYQEWRAGEGIPVHTGLVVEDINALEVGQWERTGQRGALVNLYGSDGMDDLQLHELAPGGETTVQHHFYDEIVYVSQGRGLTEVGVGEEAVEFEWGEDALFTIPWNTPYRHVNLSAETPARLVAQTPLPHLFNLIKDREFYEACEYDFWGSLERESYFDGTTAVYRMRDRYDALACDANYIPDLSTFSDLEAREEYGAGSFVLFTCPGASMDAHIGEFDVGTYRQAHRHGPGANLLMLSGEGYSLLWREGWDERIKLAWDRHTVFAPPAHWYHQHFNVGEVPARTFAIHCPEIGTLKRSRMFDSTAAENAIVYTKEASGIREYYESELAERGLESSMPEACYTDPGFTF